MPRRDRETEDMIREALAEADEELLGDSDSRSAAELLTETFRGRNRRLAIGGVVANLALFVLTIWSGLRFLGASDAQSTAFWGIATLLAFVTLISVKIWYWLEMNRLDFTRDLKRVELRVAHLADELDQARAAKRPDGDGPRGRNQEHERRKRP